MFLCHNFSQSDSSNDGEGDPVAQPGNFQRAVVRCKTAVRSGSEFPSGVGETKPLAASNFIRVRPLQRRTIKPVLKGGFVVDKVAAGTSRQSKVVPRVVFWASRPYENVFSSGELGTVRRGRGVFYFYPTFSVIITAQIYLPHRSIYFPQRWRGWCR
jgi:hypothetical protein